MFKANANITFAKFRKLTRHVNHILVLLLQGNVFLIDLIWWQLVGLSLLICSSVTDPTLFIY